AAETGGRGLRLNSIKLNGKTEAVLIADVISPEELPRRDITVEVWINVTGGSVWNSIIGYFEDAGNVDRGWGWWLGFNGNNFCFTLSSKGSRSGDGIATYLYSPSFFDSEKWHHVAGTYDGAWQRIYVNGKLENSSDTQSGDIHYRKDASYIIGAYRDADENRAMEGWIYEARVYDRALSPDELRSHYEALADMPAIPLPTPAEAKETSPALDTAPGIWRFWKAQDGLGDTWCYGASIGPTGNLSVTHVERSMHDDYLDGYTVHPLPACLPYSNIVEGLEKHLWLFNWKDTGAIRTYEVTGNASPVNWRRHLLSSPILFSAFGLTFHPLDNHRFLYISQDQRILEFDIQSRSSKLVIQGSNTR
ncbi:MAG TPA: LamG domain-containing protein, partial [bacterium]|nr:LamG domain-containing protein [bacterium]